MPPAYSEDDVYTLALPVTAVSALLLVFSPYSIFTGAAFATLVTILAGIVYVTNVSMSRRAAPDDVWQLRLLEGVCAGSLIACYFAVPFGLLWTVRIHLFPVTHAWFLETFIFTWDISARLWLFCWLALGATGILLVGLMMQAASAALPESATLFAWSKEDHLRNMLVLGLSGGLLALCLV